LNMLGSISISPCEAVKVVVIAPDCRAPWAAPAAPPSLGCDPKWCNHAVRRDDFWGLLSLAAAGLFWERAFQ